MCFLECALQSWRRLLQILFNWRFFYGFFYREDFSVCIERTFFIEREHFSFQNVCLNLGGCFLIFFFTGDHFVAECDFALW
jgi:hypothetical protein